MISFSGLAAREGSGRSRGENNGVFTSRKLLLVEEIIDELGLSKMGESSRGWVADLSWGCAGFSVTREEFVSRGGFHAES